MLNISVALYPQETVDSDAIINNAISTLKDSVTTVRVGPVDTEFSADPEIAWKALRTMYEHAESIGEEVSMEVTITNSEI